VKGRSCVREAAEKAEIEGIRRLLAADVPCLVHPFLREGTWVRVKRGPLRDLEGLLVRFKNKTRLMLSITLLSQSVTTEIDSGDVEVVRPGRINDSGRGAVVHRH